MKLPRKEKKDLCVLDVFKATWKMLQKSKDLEDAKARFKKLVLKLILDET